MATVAAPMTAGERQPDFLSGTPRAHAVDRWIYVFTAASFIIIVLAGFVPSSLAKITAVEAGARAPFPMVLHMHAVLMGSFLLLLLAQTILVATGRCELHRRLGMVSVLLVPALVVVGLVLVPTTHHGLWAAAETAPPAARAEIQQLIGFLENIMLLQLRIGILFPLLIFIALKARAADPGLHKRMMILATAIPLPAGIDRIPWLPTSLPASPISADLYMLVAISPMFIWDVVRNRRVHRAYWLWFALFLPFTLAVYSLWDSAWWHSAARRLIGI